MLHLPSGRRAKSTAFMVAPFVVVTIALGMMVTNEPLVQVFILFFGAIVVFALEDKLVLNKAPVALVVGGVMVIIASTTLTPEVFEHEQHELIVEIGQIVVFVMIAVLNAAIIVHHRAFDRLRTAIYDRHWSDRRQFTVIALIVPLMSMVLDNLTATVIGLSMSLMFFTNRKNIVITAVMIIIGANAGGAPSPVGDITTTMLWLEGRFTAQQVIAYGLLPNLAMFVIPFVWFRRQIEDVENGDSTVEQVQSLTFHEKVVIVSAFSAFFLPVVLKTIFHLLPWQALGIGFGIAWMVSDAPNFIRKYKRVIREAVYNEFSSDNGGTHDETGLDTYIEHELRDKVTIGEIMFFVGVLSMVTGLRMVDGLIPIAEVVYGGTQPEGIRLILGHVVMGLLSAVFDNIPLTAMVIQMLDVVPGNSWVLLAATAGNGGSLLFYGSAAGVVAYGMLRMAGVPFGYVDYLKKVSVPVLVGYTLMVTVWYVQYLFVGM